MLNTITHTVDDVMVAVKRQFGDESGVQLTNSDIIRWINNGQTQIVAKNGVIEGKFTTDLVANQAEYLLPSEQILHIVSIHVNGTRVENREFADIERRGVLPLNEPATTQPLYWTEWAGQITFWPTPSEGVTGGVVIYAIKMPTPVTAASNLLSLPDKYFEALVNWCMMKAYEMDEDYEASAGARQQFSLSLDEKNGEEERSQHATYPLINFVE